MVPRFRPLLFHTGDYQISLFGIRIIFVHHKHTTSGLMPHHHYTATTPPGALRKMFLVYVFNSDLSILSQRISIKSTIPIYNLPFIRFCTARVTYNSKSISILFIKLHYQRPFTWTRQGASSAITNISISSIHCWIKTYNSSTSN